jgi:hypothetical protein
MMPKDILTAMAAKERMELYCMAKPGSPGAVRRPQLSIPFRRLGCPLGQIYSRRYRGIWGNG